MDNLDKKKRAWDRMAPRTLSLRCYRGTRRDLAIAT